MFHISKLEVERGRSTTHQTKDSKSPPIIIKHTPELEVEAILRYRRVWYSPESNLWEPSKNLANTPELIVQYHLQTGQPREEGKATVRNISDKISQGINICNTMVPNNQGDYLKQFPQSGQLHIYLTSLPVPAPTAIQPLPTHLLPPASHQISCLPIPTSHPIIQLPPAHLHQLAIPPSTPWGKKPN
ncbi:hypothetical protein DSO57_1024246 [Entomophthora muscae]|uniref:Uncharacterized protein n=1 Tax=Entomophthora muscae TaxID=34485 RepID=A0ACC2UP07_9FUNG|nr:hypothetical protein DSO57_1024246 [Entomophthora muscae]